MAKTKNSSIAEQEISFITVRQIPQKTGVNLQSLDAVAPISKKVGEVKKDYDAILQQVHFILADSDEEVKKNGFSLDEVKISLGFNAKGKIAFIAEAGVEASIEISFKRRQ